ncbi:MAG: elongation factor Ts [Gammaproteobacteria bacterium]|nr:elongation factor Ts [Gammaproteobacteria bacterium]
MIITATMVKELRERTGAGMMECKKALQESKGDLDLAIENMRKAGQAKADKKSSRTAAEGVICIKITDDAKQAVILEINCETDFVARDSGFLGFVKLSADTALENGVADEQQLLNQKANGAETIEETRRNLISKIGENINVRRLASLKSQTGRVGSYLHGDRIGVLVEMEGGSASLAKDVAMHIAAAAPVVVSPADVSQETIDKEREIFSAQAAQSGKPAEIIEKMVSGRINKFLDEVSLLGQPFIKNPETTVGKLLKAENAKVISFVRYQVGEGIEKKQENFAEEVMAQVKGS